MSPARVHRGRRRAAILAVACAALDSVAVWLLLGGALFPLPGLDTVPLVAAGVVHAIAVLLFVALAPEDGGRRWLGGMALLAVPGAGAAVAITAVVAPGRGELALRRRRKAFRRRHAEAEELRRIGCALPLCDALHSSDDEQRRRALTVLSRRADPEAISLLLRAARAADPELALSAALALDEISERAERRSVWARTGELRHAAG